jgi:hypothetical protein
MAVNYSDPRFQQMLLRRAAMSPYGGVRGASKETAAWAGEQERTRLQLTDVGLRSQMQRAQIEQMGFNRSMAEKRLGLEQGYLGLAGQEMGLREKEMGLREKEMGLRGQELGLRSSFQGLSEQRGAWQNRQKMRELADNESELSLRSWLGIGQAAWGGYEGYRRAQERAEDRTETAEYKKRLREKGLM